MKTGRASHELPTAQREATDQLARDRRRRLWADPLDVRHRRRLGCRHEDRSGRRGARRRLDRDQSQDGAASRGRDHPGHPGQGRRQRRRRRDAVPPRLICYN